MKKTAFLLLCFLFVLICFSGCEENDSSEILGKWVPATAQINGETIQYSELGVNSNQFEFNFENGGKCKTTLAGVSSEGSYSFNGTSVDVEVNGDIKKLDYDNGTLTLVLNYDSNTTTFTFTKAR